MEILRLIPKKTPKISNFDSFVSWNQKVYIKQRLVTLGMINIKLGAALDIFRKGKASTSEAAEIAGLSIGEIMDEIVKRGLKSNITKEDLKGSLERAMKAIK